MKKLLTALALAAIFVFVVAPPAIAQAPSYSAVGSATSTNAVVTLSPAGTAKFVEVSNLGSGRIYVAQNAVATAANAANRIILETCESAKFYARSNLNTLGIITAANTTSTYKVRADYADVTSSNARVVGMPFENQVQISVLAGCNASTLLTANGAQLVPYQDSELITLATGAATTNSTGNLLHANSIIDAVVCRVTTTITTAVTWQISDTVTAGRFSATSATMTAGATIVGLAHMFGVVTTTAAGPTQAADAVLRLTMNANPGAGVVRCTVFGRTFVAPTS